MLVWSVGLTIDFLEPARNLSLRSFKFLKNVPWREKTLVADEQTFGRETIKKDIKKEGGRRRSHRRINENWWALRCTKRLKIRITSRRWYVLRHLKINFERILNITYMIVSHAEKGSFFVVSWYSKEDCDLFVCSKWSYEKDDLSYQFGAAGSYANRNASRNGRRWPCTLQQRRRSSREFIHQRIPKRAACFQGKKKEKKEEAEAEAEMIIVRDRNAASNEREWLLYPEVRRSRLFSLSLFFFSFFSSSRSKIRACRLDERWIKKNVLRLHFAKREIFFFITTCMYIKSYMYRVVGVYRVLSIAMTFDKCSNGESRRVAKYICTACHSSIDYHRK